MQLFDREKASTDLLGRKVDEAKEKSPTPHFPQYTHWWTTIVIPLSLPHHLATSAASDHITQSPLTGKKLHPNQGQLHRFFSPSVFKALSQFFLLVVEMIKKQISNFKACGHWGRRRSTSIDKRG